MTNNKNEKSPPHSLISFFSIIILFAALGLFNLPIIDTLIRHSFDDGTYSHAYLIPFIVVYLFYQLARSGKLIFREKLSKRSIGILILSALLLFVTSNAQISLGYWVAILALTCSSLIVLFNFSWVTLFPAVFLIFIFPFWGLLVPFLQNLSVAAVTFIMGFTGIPTFVEAEFITIPAGVFEIADGCSGLRYFIVSLAISSLFIFLYIKSLKRAALFFGVAILGALITNWIRITLLIMIGEYTNMESSLMEDHNAFGWYIYIPFMILLFKWGNSLVDTDIFENNSLLTTNAKPKFPVVFILLATIVLSSTTIKSFLNNTSTVQTTNLVQTDSILPSVSFYSGIIKQPLNIPDGIYQIYQFDGSDLDGKPSFYDNDMLPKNHRVISSKVINNWNVQFVQTVSTNAVILFKYEIDNIAYSNISAFKLARLKKALMNVNNTKLHWVYLPCQRDCDRIMNNFIKRDK
ncbi:exosortase [Thalassotalea piscium]